MEKKYTSTKKRGNLFGFCQHFKTNIKGDPKEENPAGEETKRSNPQRLQLKEGVKTFGLNLHLDVIMRKPRKKNAQKKDSREREDTNSWGKGPPKHFFVKGTLYGGRSNEPWIEREDPRLPTSSVPLTGKMKPGNGKPPGGKKKGQAHFWSCVAL